ncbi:hypothetical protein IQ265_03965 [Nodosilinea sp. LEGE 06152]|uniref:hypothetical protein n=1 Tax=Nodosilinea sp. LEGE 06152 TaxID=2777966 RepID=UPI00187F8B5B|nr:hypothetical protein [Nodosilinea sp. LEGE 06152]MBE9155991.1 hypothetical protein [Nodosilinea sp. LEGE 06152]
MDKNSDALPNGSQHNEHLFIEALAALPEKPMVRRRQNTAYDLVLRCYASLKQAKMKGHSYEDLAALFERDLSRTITPGTLRKYMNRAAKVLTGEKVPDPGEADHASTTSSVPIKHAPQSVPLPKRAEPKPATLPRPALYGRDPRAQASEDEFENL